MVWRIGWYGLMMTAMMPWSVVAYAVEAADTYLVGAAIQDITPDYPIRLSGFGFRRTESEGITAPIHARAIAVGSDSDGPAVLMAVDTTGVSDAVVSELARRLVAHGVKPDRLTVTGTHTHTAPMLSGVLPTLFGLPVPPEHQVHIDQYTNEFTDRLEQVALTALKDRQPAKLFWGVGEVTFAKNRRSATGPIDHSLPVLAVKSPKGQLRAILTTYACHAVTLSHNFIGGDWPGFAADSFERQHPGTVALISIGCGADQNPKSNVTGDKVDVAQAQGLELATEVDRVLQGALRPIAGPLTTTLNRIDLPLDDLPPRSHWEQLVAKGSYIGYHAQVQLAKLDRGEALRTKIDYPVQTWTFGDSLAMVFLPGEVVVDYAHRLRRELDRDRVWITAYANDTPCYIPSERVLAEGGYEGATAMTYYDWPAKLRTGVEQRIVEEVRKQVPQGYHATATASTEPPPLTPQQSQKRMRIPPDCTLQLVAAEPLTIDPVAIDFGPDGRLWICEMHDYPAGLHGNFEPGGKIRVLRDDDGDGVYDRSTVFLDGLPFPTGVTVWRNGVLVCAAPDILYAEDTDGDDRADVRRVLFTGFGTENYQARVNSLTYGLDGWVYGSCGLFGGNIRSEITGETVALGNRDFRIDPDRGVIEPLSGRTQQGRVRNDDGDWFGCSNSQPVFHYPLLDDASRRGLPLPPLVVQVTAGADPLQMFPTLAEYQRFKLSGPAGRVTAACGLGLYRDDWLGPDFVDTAIVCEPVNLVVHRRRLVHDGVTFTGQRIAGEEQSELLTATDNWFRPVQVRTGLDGGLWIVDMSRAVIEHPRWIPEEIRAALNVRAGESQGRIYRMLPRERGPRPVPDLTRLTSVELVQQLASPNGTVRDLAQQLLWWRDDRTVIPQLQGLAARAEASVTARSAALWVLSRWQLLSAETLQAALESSEPRLRRQAGRMLADHPLAAQLLPKLPPESDPLVLLELIEVLRHRPQDQSPTWLAELLLKSWDDLWLRFATLRAVAADQWDSFTNAVLTRQFDLQYLEPLLAISLAEEHTAAIAALFDRIVPATAGQAPASWRLVEQLVQARTRQPKPFAQLLTMDRTERLNAVLATAEAMFQASDTPDAQRASVVGLLGYSQANRDDTLTALGARLTPQSSPALQSRIIVALDRIAGDRAPDLLLERWSALGPAARSEMLDRLLSRPATAKKLLDAVAQGQLPVGTLDATRRQALLQHRDTTVRELATRVLQANAETSRGAVLAQHRSVLSLTGDPHRGRELLTKRCSICHAWEGQGHAVGPDLGESRNKAWSALLESILDPNRAVDQRYAVYTAITTDGHSVQGLVANENETTVTLKMQEAKLTTLARADLEEFGSSGRSLMPDGLERDLSPQDFADVFALLTQKTTSGEAARPSVFEIAKQILDDNKPRPEREQLIAEHLDRAADLIAAMAEGLGGDAVEEYRRIPWIWRVAVAAGKQNHKESLQAVLKASLPKTTEPLADWQAVVIGGGVVNGISLVNVWPHERIAELIGNDRDLRDRWQHALTASSAMADNTAVKHGTRYDALRMVAMLGWSRSGPQLLRYLPSAVNAELQMGAVSGLVDIPDPPATMALIEHFAGLAPRNKELALEGLLRSEARMLAVLDAVETGRLTKDQLGAERIKKLREATSNKVKARAAAVLR